MVKFVCLFIPLLKNGITSQITYQIWSQHPTNINDPIENAPWHHWSLDSFFLFGGRGVGAVLIIIINTGVDGRETKVGYKNVPIWLNKKKFVVPLIMDVDELQATIIIKLKFKFFFIIIYNRLQNLTYIDTLLNS